jgi:glycogen synthase
MRRDLVCPHLNLLSCGTPIVVTMTGGLQEQVTDGENWFGVGIEPTSKGGYWIAPGALGFMRIE